MAKQSLSVARGRCAGHFAGKRFGVGAVGLCLAALELDTSDAARDWVLSQAVRQAALWHQRGHALPIAVCRWRSRRRRDAYRQAR